MRFLPDFKPPSDKQPSALWFIFDKSKLLTKITGDTITIPCTSDLSDVQMTPARFQYLGTLDGYPCYAAEFTEGPPGADNFKFKDLRALFGLIEEDLIWIREPFLSHTGEFGRLIVHGHTPVTARTPDWRGNRLNIDTRAGYDGPLTAVIFGEGARDPLAVLTDRGELPIGTACQPEQT